MSVSIPSHITEWSGALYVWLGGVVGVAAADAPGITVKVRFADGRVEELKGGRDSSKSWWTLRKLDPGDLVVVVPPAAPLPPVCHCEHADCCAAAAAAAAPPPGFATVEALEEHHLKDHKPAAGSRISNDPLFSREEDITTPEWRRVSDNPTLNYKRGRTRWYKYAQLGKGVVPVSSGALYTSFPHHFRFPPTLIPLSCA